MLLPKLKYIVAPSVAFMWKQSYPRPEEEVPSKFVLLMPQSIRVNLVYRGALVKPKMLNRVRHKIEKGKLILWTEPNMFGEKNMQ